MNKTIMLSVMGALLFGCDSGELQVADGRYADTGMYISEGTIAAGTTNPGTTTGDPSTTETETPLTGFWMFGNDLDDYDGDTVYAGLYEELGVSPFAETVEVIDNGELDLIWPNVLDWGIFRLLYYIDVNGNGNCDVGIDIPMSRLMNMTEEMAGNDVAVEMNGTDPWYDEDTCDFM